MHVITNENVFLRICEAEAFWDIQEHWTSHETMFTIEGRIEDIGATQLRSGHGGGRVFPGEYVHISLARVSLFPVLSAVFTVWCTSRREFSLLYECCFWRIAVRCRDANIEIIATFL